MTKDKQLGVKIIDMFQEDNANPKDALLAMANVVMSTITVMAQNDEGDTASAMGKRTAEFVNSLHEIATEILITGAHK